MDCRETMLIFGLMLILIKTAACEDRLCRLNQPDPCYAALRGSLNLDIGLDSSKYELKITKTTDENPQVCKVTNGRKRRCDFLHYRLQLTDRGLIINYLMKADSGTYTLTLTNSTGAQILKENFQVIVEAPIGSVLVSIFCSSNGAMNVSCFSDGDPMIYSWTLNGETLMEGNSSVQISEGTEGNISCSDHISQSQEKVELICPTGVDRLCWFNQSDQCFANVGDKFSLQTVNDARGVELDLYKGPSGSGLRVLKLSGNIQSLHESIRNRSLFIMPSWTLIIKSVITADSGDYRLEIYDSSGTQISEQHLHIEVFSDSPVCVLIWCVQMMVLLGLLGGFHIYIRLTAGKKQDDQNLRMSRFREEQEDS